MKKSYFILFFLFFAFQANAQFERTLLWEISGNGVKKKSYVYGTFHVSDKISYHLSDAFYKHLLEADIVSNESNPDSWGELFDLFMGSRQFQKPEFYSNFYLKTLKKQELLPLFMNYNFFDQMASGSEGKQADYSENTVLDMFIYQTAKKYNKKTIGLENAKKSFLTLKKSQVFVDSNDKEEEITDESEEKKALLMKLLKGKSLYTTLKDFYREKDIVMLDSLSKLSEKPEKHKILIIDRNYDMVRSIDSLAHQGSLFSAVGAAHLGGKEGILQLLINKGYKVTPVLSPLTKKGEIQKKTIEEYFPNPKSKSEPTEDQMIQGVNFDLAFGMDNVKSTLDITNGGVLTMIRVPLRDYLQKKNENFNYRTIDTLLYELIPGEIIEKKEIKDESYVGFDIKNKSKTGNFQHYRLYVTPLEIIGFTFLGSGGYVKQYEQAVYDKFKIKGFKKTWQKVHPQKGGFSVLMPEFCVQYGNNEKAMSDVTFEAYDPLDKSYFFLIENTAFDMDFLDDKNFQHQQIHNEFYMNQDIEQSVQFDGSAKEFVSSALNGQRKVKLKSAIRGHKYYLLGSVDASDENTAKFFESFAFEPFTSSETAVYHDTIGKYQIEIPKKINEQTLLGINNDVLSARHIKIDTDGYFKPKEFESNTGQVVSLEIENYPRYYQVTAVDSLKKEYSKELKTLFDKFRIEDEKPDPLVSTWSSYFDEFEKTEVLSNNFSHNTALGCEVSDAMVSVANSNQSLKIRTFFMNNRKITLKTIVDRSYKNDDAFIEKAFSSFVPEKSNDRSIFEDKVKLFLKEAASDTDSIRKIAFNNIYALKLKETDFDPVTHFLDTFQFKDSDATGKSVLYRKLGNLNNPKVIPYLENKYKADGTKTVEQLAILGALASQNTQASYKLVLKLMEFDLPVTENGLDIIELFDLFHENLAQSKVLFPDVFQFYGIEEYNLPIVKFCNEILDKKLGSPKKIAAFQKLILTHSKLEYKRTVNREEKKTAAAETEYAEDYDDYYEEAEEPNAKLINYLSLLSHFPNNSSVNELMEKIKKINNPEIQLEILKLEIDQSKASKESIKKALENPKTKFNTVLLLQDNDEFDVLPTVTEDEIAESAMNYFDKLKENTKIQFLEKREINKGSHKAVFYFYQTQNTKDGKTTGGKTFNSMAFLMENGKIVPKAYFSPVLEQIDEENTIAILTPAIMKETMNEGHKGSSFRKKNDANQYNYEE